MGEHGVSLENMGNMENMDNMEKMENMEMFSGSPTEIFSGSPTEIFSGSPTEIFPVIFILLAKVEILAILLFLTEVFSSIFVNFLNICLTFSKKIKVFFFNFSQLFLIFGEWWGNMT